MKTSMTSCHINLKDNRTITLLPSQLKIRVVSYLTQTSEAEFSHRLWSSLKFPHWWMKLRSCSRAGILAFLCRSCIGSQPVAWSGGPGRSKWRDSRSCWGRPGSTRRGARFSATTEHHSSGPRLGAARLLWWLWTRWRGARTPRRPLWCREPSSGSVCDGPPLEGLQQLHSACWGARRWCRSRSLWLTPERQRWATPWPGWGRGRKVSCYPPGTTSVHHRTPPLSCTPGTGCQAPGSTTRLQRRWHGCTGCSSCTWSPSVSPQPGSDRHSCRWGRRCWRSGSQQWCSCSACTACPHSAQSSSSRSGLQRWPTEAAWGRRRGRPGPGWLQTCPPDVHLSLLCCPPLWSQRGYPKSQWRRWGNTVWAGRC